VYVSNACIHEIYYTVITTLYFYISGGMASFPIMPNCLVHIIMYTYYLLTAMGTKWQKKIAKYKKYLTVIQMVS